MNAIIQSLLVTTALAWQAAPAVAGVAADAHEAHIPARQGVAVEPAHRAQVIAPGIKAGAAARIEPTWVVTEPVRRRVLLPGEERALIEAMAAEAAAEMAAAEFAAAEAAREAALRSGDLRALALLDSRALAAGKTRQLAVFYFAFDSSKPADLPAIEEVARMYSQAPRLRVIGHADDAGSGPYNAALSLRRANSVVATLVRAGIPRDRLEVSGAGESEPASKSEASLNRRVEIHLVGGVAK